MMCIVPVGIRNTRIAGTDPGWSLSDRCSSHAAVGPAGKILGHTENGFPPPGHTDVSTPNSTWTEAAPTALAARWPGLHARLDAQDALYRTRPDDGAVIVRGPSGRTDTGLTRYAALRAKRRVVTDRGGQSPGLLESETSKAGMQFQQGSSPRFQLSERVRLELDDRRAGPDSAPRTCRRAGACRRHVRRYPTRWTGGS